MTIRKDPWRWVFLGFTLLWMVFIFCMSAFPAKDSDVASGRLVTFVQQVFFKRWEALPAGEFTILLGRLHYLIRKTAHFTEYLILGSSISLVLMTFRRRFSFRFAAAFPAGVLYAVTDEVHQLFVAGRDGAVFDVLVDTGGVFAGCLLVFGICAMALADRQGPDRN